MVGDWCAERAADEARKMILRETPERKVRRKGFCGIDWAAPALPS